MTGYLAGLLTGWVAGAAAFAVLTLAAIAVRETHGRVRARAAARFEDIRHQPVPLAHAQQRPVAVGPAVVDALPAIPQRSLP